jgi:hypothetical protein
LSPEPAGAGWNLYAYGTNPNGGTDPSGLWWGIFPFDSGYPDPLSDEEQESEGGIRGAGIFSGQDCISCFPLGGVNPAQILQAVLTGNYGGIYQGLGLPGDLSCPQWMGPMCGGVSPIMDASPFAPDPNVEQKVRACESGIRNSMAGKVVAFGSLASFVDNAWDTAKSWAEAILTKGTYVKIMEVAGQSVTPAGETTYITTVVKPAVGKAATMGMVLATVTDLASRSGCRIANDPNAMAAYTANPF